MVYINSKYGKVGPRFKDLVGQKFGLLKVLDFANRNKSELYKWKCICDCGNIVIRNGSDLKRTKHLHSCGCTIKYWKNKDEHAFNRLLSSYKQSAKLRNIEFLLTSKQFSNIIKRNCYYCNSKPEPRLGKWARAPIIANGIDRLNNKKGYIKNNCVAACKKCNIAKNIMNKKEFLNWIKMIYLYNFGDKNV